MVEYLKDVTLERPMFQPEFSPLSLEEKLPLISLPELYVGVAVPLLANARANPLGTGNPFNMDGWKREMIGKRLAELEHEYERTAQRGYMEFMQALDPRINVTAEDHTHIATQYEKLRFLLNLPETRRKELWKSNPDIYSDIEGIVDYSRGKHYLPVGVRDRMEKLKQKEIDMEAVSYIDVIAGDVRNAPAFSTYRRKTDLRRWEKVVQLIFHRYNTHENNSTPGTDEWVPAPDDIRQIMASALPLDFIGFSAIYIGRRNPFERMFHQDPMMPIVKRMTAEELPSFGFYREPRNDYALEKAKLRRAQIIYADASMSPFEANINDLASLIALQERGEGAHEKKVEDARKEHHGMPYTQQQNIVLENLLRAFANDPIVPADRHQ